MGTCYSKAGHEAGAQSKEKRPKEKKGEKNGHADSVKNHLVVPEIQKDLSDTIYTEDSHIPCPNIDNCLNKSQQTSLEKLTRDANKNIETKTFEDFVNKDECLAIETEWGENDFADARTALLSKHVDMDVPDGKVSASDSGIVVELSCKNCDRVDPYSDSFESRVELVDDVWNANKTDSETSPEKAGKYSDLCMGITDRRSQQINQVSEHSVSRSDVGGHEDSTKESVTSIDRLSEHSRVSEPDFDKIRLALHRPSSVGSPTDHRSFLDSSEASFEISSGLQQPEVMTMTMNGREVVIIDADLFSQIIDEIQILKMKLSQLTEVIQDGEEGEVGTSVSVLSSSA
ncbi:uncharacterized protein LOC127867475 isoform X1 [Dreissena polymorpha]|uniref:Uncharacterized protein n=1 Tax=Dreissena polymorpha TaxID=45954 RepID=A0A9D4RG91_DREPO|nr:uncharacterized protein LOC127867475 isoform X1 [Dreissena polymorpha]XP_052264594.1 uncharacterized protein LOC127867475 isoform X1 [Dreissena polymorpha]KAH3867179.1 hypothetical protein DPMN_030304 [Dreissena polymorpha]